MTILMSDDARNRKKDRQHWLTRLDQILLRCPQNSQQLIQLLRHAKQRGVLNTQALKMLEGVLQISDRQVRDIMVPRAKMTLISNTASLSELLPIVTASGHSRFPVIQHNTQEVIGLLLAKDLLKYSPLSDQSAFDIHHILRPAVFIPESKRLDSLLEEFQYKHYHMAIVVDEYGAVSGLVTIEDVLEEIVGEIEDEYDESEEDLVQKQGFQQFKVNARMTIEDFNAYFHSTFATEQFDTIGGLIANRFGYLPKRGASIRLTPFRFKVLHADNRQIRSLEVTVDGETHPR